MPRITNWTRESRIPKLAYRNTETNAHAVLHLADMDAYEQVNETYEQCFEETYPARTTVGVCELLGGAAVTVDAVVAVE